MVGVSSDSRADQRPVPGGLGLPYPGGRSGGAISGAYNVRWPIVGLAQRVTYAIGRNTKVLLAFHSELNMDAHASKACEAVAGLAS